jgi:anti-sigma B factor antagonist
MRRGSTRHDVEMEKSDPRSTSEAIFELSDSVDSGVPVLVVQGEVDVATAPELRERLVALHERGDKIIVVDMSKVTFVDSSALGVLVSAVKRFRAEDGDLRLVVTEPHISKVFEITALTDVFAIYETAEAAATS